MCTKPPVAPTSSPGPSAMYAGLAAKDVLIVDDDEDARELLRYLLERSHMAVHCAASVGEALGMLEESGVDLIISDIGMPERDGYSFIRAVRASEEQHKASIPAIALTAFAQQEDRMRALHEGFDLHMAKPLNAPHLLDAMLKLLPEHKD